MSEYFRPEKDYRNDLMGVECRPSSSFRVRRKEKLIKSDEELEIERMIKDQKKKRLRELLTKLGTNRTKNDYYLPCISLQGVEVMDSYEGSIDE